VLACCAALAPACPADHVPAAAGFFGGGLQPNQQASSSTRSAVAARRAFGVVAIATIVAPMLGPTLGGYITDNLSWRWIFFINVPIGMLGLFGVAALVEDPPWEKNEPKAAASTISACR
jgi:DHA2 family multidrug resistance protein